MAGASWKAVIRFDPNGRAALRHSCHPWWNMIMPSMGGNETYDRLRELNPNIRVLLSSGYSIEGLAKTILAKGCDGFIQKPFNLKDLSKKVREILNKK